MDRGNASTFEEVLPYRGIDIPKQCGFASLAQASLRVAHEWQSVRRAPREPSGHVAPGRRVGIRQASKNTKKGNGIMHNWRWDQGRLEYFRFLNLRRTAKSLVALDGTTLGMRGADLVSAPLRTQTGLTFPPTHYKVWRNFRRVFECSLLATDLNGLLTVTDVCHWLGSSSSHLISVDEYLSFLAPRFFFPFPAFDDYDANAARVFPICAVLRYLLAASSAGRETSISVAELFSLLIGNDCDGTEPIPHYLSLRPTTHAPVGDQSRQARELLIFASQLSFLKWYRQRLYLDVLEGDADSFAAIQRIATPFLQPRHASKAEEVISLGTMSTPIVAPILDTTRRQPSDVLFTEGKKVRATHLRTERSPYLRQWLFANMRRPFLCDMCGQNYHKIYPWTDNILEVHHLLPLSSALLITPTGTSLDDIVALCPNCHRSVHSYYKKWLNSASQEDFQSKEEASKVYQRAKAGVVLS